MTDTARDPAVQELLDRVAIQEVLARYCHAVDRCDKELLSKVYWPDGTDDHVFWEGTGEAFVDFCIPVVEQRDQTWHSITNHIIRIEGDTARSQCYFNAYERVKRKSGGSNDVTFIGRYVDILTKRNGEWRIFKRKCVIDSWRIWPDTADWDRGIFGTKINVGKRREEDYAHEVFGDRLLKSI